MPPKSKDGPVISTSRGEVLRFKSPAEFFSENKNIAGFDNPGKSLYTTIRELVENSLDACESISVLPDIEITVQELDGAAISDARSAAFARAPRTFMEEDGPAAGVVACPSNFEDAST